MSGRYIDADKFKDFVDMTCDAGGLMYPVVREIKEYVKKQIDGQPTADVHKNERGEWIEWQKCTPFYIQDLYKCSKCNESYLKELVYFLDNLQYRFCPNCGADMRKGEEE